MGAGDLRDATAEPIDRTDDEGVACAGVVEHRSHPWPGCLDCTGEFVAEDPSRVAAGGTEA
jgi:hypothetical protein